MTDSIHSIIRNQFLDKRAEICDELIKKQQKEDDDYITKTPHDKIICSICGGKYVRYAKSKHEKTNKHQAKIKEIHNFVYKQNLTNSGPI